MESNQNVGQIERYHANTAILRNMQEPKKNAGRSGKYGRLLERAVFT